MVKLVAVKPHKVYSRSIRVGETYEVSPRDALMVRKMGWAEEAGPGTADPVFSRGGTYARRDMQAAKPQKSQLGSELESLTRAELVELAEKESIDHSSRDTKAALASKIEEARRTR